MQLILSNEKDAFNELYRRYKTSIYSYLYQAVGSEDADEVFQEIFLKLVRFKESFKFESKVKTWIWSITRNAVIDFYRSKDHQYKNAFEEIVNEEGEELLSDDQLSIEDAILNKTNNHQLKICINELNGEQKEAIIMSTFSELSNKEIALILKITESKVKSLIFRAKDKLINCFKKGGHL